MKRNSIFLDSKILIVFVSTFLISAVVLAYRTTTSEPCGEVAFNTVEKQYKVGEMVKFTDATEGAKIWEWDFGDSSTTSTRAEPLHIYKKAGDYNVTLKVNNSCSITKTVVITDKEKLLDPSIFPSFELPESIAFGEPLTVTDKTNGATSWEWRFGETSTANATTQTATYEFIQPGLKTVSLIVNGNLDYITKKKINILPPEKQDVQIIQIKDEKPKGWNIKYKPTQPEIDASGEAKEKPVVVPYISDAEFERRIMLVSEEKMSAKDFSEYFCGDINKPVVANGENTTFLVLCEKLKDKKLKLKSVQIFRNSGSNCIKTITIEYKKKGWF